MDSIINYHVIDRKNIGDILSAPTNYFTFPGYQLERADIRQIEESTIREKHVIVGGGGLIYSRFISNISGLIDNTERGKLIAWGVGYQAYGDYSNASTKYLEYSKYLDKFDLVGIRDFGSKYDWVPCASCMHPSFSKKREVKHKFVVFSHKKFQLKIENFPRMTNEAKSLDEVLDFLGSGDTILTSSYHGAYWGILLGRKVLAFPFSSKFYELKHKPGIYPVQKWHQSKIRLSVFGKLIYEFRYKNKYSCKSDEWQDALNYCEYYPDSLQESRASNQRYYSRILEILAE